LSSVVVGGVEQTRSVAWFSTLLENPAGNFVDST